MESLRLPANDWKPRDYQIPAWQAWREGCLRQLGIWHRRAGKDEIELQKHAVGAHRRVGTYWHMLPQYSQARKAIWNAVNPHTGKRRIDEVFPHEIRANTNEQEMFIRFKIGSTWQVVGSDNFNSLVGTPPVGITFSEWALANPTAWAYLRPILDENGGWASFITTPRGNNHAKKMFDAHLDDPKWFVEKLTVEETGVVSDETIEDARKDYAALFGPEVGNLLVEQEYYCSWAGALVGSYYAGLIDAAEKEGRLKSGELDTSQPVCSAWDIGTSDDTAIWCFQVRGESVHVVDCYIMNGQPSDHYAEWLIDRGYTGPCFLPHDAHKSEFVGDGRTIADSIRKHGLDVRRVPSVRLQEGINAARKTLPRCRFTHSCEAGLDALRAYRREWNDDLKTFRDRPVHDWASHPADGFRYMALSWRMASQPKAKPKPKHEFELKPDGTVKSALTISEMIKRQTKKRKSSGY